MGVPTPEKFGEEETIFKSTTIKDEVNSLFRKLFKSNTSFNEQMVQMLAEKVLKLATTKYPIDPSEIMYINQN